jgi:hypothetical protein
MKRTGRSLGAILLLLAAASALAEAIAAEGARGAVSLGWIWFQIQGNSLVGFQALIEKSASPVV